MRRPRDVVAPGPGQESVWDYPRPPKVESANRRIDVVLGGQLIATTSRAVRTLETSHPPTWYLPFTAFVEGSLQPGVGSSFCEFKGFADYLDVVGGEVRAAAAAWTYPNPTSGFALIADHVALYPGRMDCCTIDGEVVQAQEGGFYGGWITSDVVGPFKGAPGTQGW